jgi:PAS domain S-box-containing protein
MDYNNVSKEELIRELKRCKAALTEAKSANSMELVLNSIGTVVCVSELQNYDLLFINAAGRRALGPGIEGKKCYEVMQGLDRPCDYCSKNRLLDTARNPTGDNKREIQNPISGRWYDMTYSTIPWVDGKTARMGIATDITDYKVMEAALRESEERYRSLIDSADAAITMIDAGGRFIFANSISANHFGLTPDKMTGLNISDVFTPENAAEVLSNIQKVISSGSGITVETNVLTNETQRWVRTSIQPVKNSAGEIYAILNFVTDISETKNAEFKVRESEKKYKALFHNSPEAFLIIVDGVFVECNSASETLIGGSRSDIVGKTPSEISPEYQPNGERSDEYAKKLIRETFSTEKTSFEWVHLRKDGTPFMANIKLTGIEYEGKPALLVNWRDITERELIQREIETNELRHRQAASQSRTVIWEVDLNGLYTYVSEVSSEVYGYKPEELVLKRYFFDLHPDEIREKFKKTGLELINSGKMIIDFDNPIETKEGETIWVSTNGTPINDKNGILVGFRGSDIDITGKKKIEAEMLDINANLEQRIIDRTAELQAAMSEITDLYENAPCGYHSLDSSGLFIRINSTELSWLGYTAEEVVGEKHFADIVTPESFLIFKENFPVFKKQGFINDLEFELIRKDGTTFLVSLYATAVKDLDGNYLMSRSTLFDITARKQAETALENAMQEAESANKAKSEFLANMSHEIRTPMNAVLGYTELLGSTIIDQTQKGYVNSIKSSGKGLLTLINDILDLSKIEAGKLELEFDYVDTNAFFSEFERIFSLKVLEKGLKFDLEIASGTPPGVYIDESRVRQVIFNLLGNAIKFTKEGAIKLKVYTENPQIVNYPNDRSEEFIDLVIEVEDSGIGISRELQESIFQPFTQERGSKYFGGTGLGLTISKRLLTLMNGSITVYSEIGKGSRFTVKIPEISYLLDYASSRADIRINPSDIVFSEAMILIVDDVEHNRSYLKEALKNTQLNITEAENGVVALNMAKRLKPDLIIADIRMPEMDGFQLLHKIKSNKKLKHIPVLAYSASVLKAQKERIHSSDFSGLLIKPVNVTELYLALMNILPYRSIRQENNHDSAQNTLITGEILDSSGLKYSLETTFTEKWKTFAVTQPLDEISDFAQELLQLGLKHNCATITDYAKELTSAADSFNVDALLKLIQKFRAINENLNNSIKAENDEQK